MNRNTKIFSFNYGLIAQLSVWQLKTMYRSIDIASDHEFLTLLYLTSEKFRVYLRNAFPEKLRDIDSEDPSYEDEVGIAISRIMWNINPEETQELTIFVDDEMDKWISWAFRLHDSNKVPVILLRYIIGRAIIYRNNFNVEEVPSD